MLNWINRRTERKLIKKEGGIPLMWLLYNPCKPKPNMEFRLYPSIRHDEYILKRFQEIADYIRDNYTEEWDYLKEE